MQDMTPTGMAMVRRWLCATDLVNGLVDAVLFTVHIYWVAREFTDWENLVAVLTEFKCYPFWKSWTVVATFSVTLQKSVTQQLAGSPENTRNWPTFCWLCHIRSCWHLCASVPSLSSSNCDRGLPVWQVCHDMQYADKYIYLCDWLLTTSRFQGFAWLC